MTEQQLLERITLNPKVMVGKPVIKGTRLTVEYMLNLLAHGATAAEILEEYQGLAPKIFKRVYCLPQSLLQTPHLYRCWSQHKCVSW